MENNYQEISIIAGVQIFEKIKACKLSENRRDIQGMIDDSTYVYQLIPQEKDKISLKSQLESAKVTKNTVIIRFSDKEQNEAEYYVTRVESEGTFTVVFTTTML